MSPVAHSGVRKHDQHARWLHDSGERRQHLYPPRNGLRIVERCAKIPGPITFVTNIGVGSVNSIARHEADVEVDRLREADYYARKQMEM